MARIPGSQSVGSASSTTLLDLYTVPVGVIATAPRLLLTNNNSASNTVTVSINNGTTSRVIARRNIAGGVGKSWIVDELRTQDLNTGYKVQIQLTNATDIIYHLSVSEVS